MNFQELVDLDFQALNFITISVRVLMAIVVGAILGYEREKSNRSAGLRTHTLVCLTACTVMMTNVYAYDFYEASSVTRMAAQVISGIGFLGAGTILVTRGNQIRGLTTAASLWSAACIGLTIGIGFYEAAIVVTIAIVIILVSFSPIKDRIQSRSDYIEALVDLSGENALMNLFNFCHQKDIHISSLHPHELQGQAKSLYYLSASLNGSGRAKFLEEFKSETGIEITLISSQME